MGLLGLAGNGGRGGIAGKIEAGIASFAALATVVVSFPTAFANAPLVVCTPTGINTNQVIWTTSISTTGFTANVTAAVTSTFDWIAYSPTG
jgi:hypothetical protein